MPVPSPEDLKLVRVATVTDITPEGQLVIDGDKIVILDNLRIPIPFQPQAQEALKAATAKVQIGIYIPQGSKDNTPKDSVGNTLAHVMTEKGLWLQKFIVEEGLAIVEDTGSDAGMLEPLLAAEEKARIARTAIWNNPSYKVISAIEAKSKINSFQIVTDFVSKVDLDKTPPVIYFGKAGELAVIFKQELRDTLRTKLNMTREKSIGSSYTMRGWLEEKSGRAVMHIRYAGQIQQDKAAIPAEPPAKTP